MSGSGTTGPAIPPEGDWEQIGEILNRLLSRISPPDIGVGGPSGVSPTDPAQHSGNVIVLPIGSLGAGDRRGVQVARRMPAGRWE